MEKKTIREIFSSNLIMILEDQGINRNDFAKRLGCSCSTVSKWLTCKTEPTLSYIIKITRVLNCTLDDLVQE